MTVQDKVNRKHVEVVPPQTGRHYGEDDSLVNLADILKDIHTTFCTCSDAIRILPTEDSVLLQDGRVFKAEIKFELANNDIRHLAFRTPPATFKLPMYVLWGQDLITSDTNNITYRMYEDAIFIAGAPQPVINQNRVLKDISLQQSILYPTPTNVDVSSATEIELLAVLGSQGTGASGKGAGGNIPGQRFTVLLPDTNYVIEIDNDDGGQTANILFKSTFLEGVFPGLYEKANP